MNRIAPQNEAETADAVRAAAVKGSSFEILSGGTKREFGRTVAAGAILDISALSGIVKYEPEELVLTARAGTPLAEIEAALAAKNQMLGFEPADWGPLFGAEAGRATLAGIVATNACGARRVKAGPVRDSVIGCRFINGLGEIVKAGAHVIKNVTGFDVPKLMCGAFGTLGVLTEITFKVAPRPERTATVVLKNCGAVHGLRTLRDAATLALDATGLAYLPRGIAGQADENGPIALIRVEGTTAAIAEKLQLLNARFADQNRATLNDHETRDLFRDVNNGGVFLNQASDIWRLCVPSSHVLAAAEQANASDWYADWAGGLLWLGLPANEEEATRLREITARYGGHATLMRAPADIRQGLSVFEPETPTHAAITRSVKAAFDPKRVLNPGRMFEGV